MTTVYNEGDCFYYTGMSSVGKDNGTVGFIMVNTRDKSVVMYRMAVSISYHLTTFLFHKNLALNKKI